MYLFYFHTIISFFPPLRSPVTIYHIIKINFLLLMHYDTAYGIIDQFDFFDLLPRLFFGVSDRCNSGCRCSDSADSLKYASCVLMRAADDAEAEAEEIFPPFFFRARRFRTKGEASLRPVRDLIGDDGGLGA